MEGKVKFFDDQKGYGFLKDDDTGQEIFCHVTGLRNCKTLGKDDKVEFDTKEGKRGLQAVNVDLVAK